MNAPPVPMGLCGRCRHATRVVTRRGTVYLRCLAPGLAKYPELPVLRCAAHAPPPDDPPSRA